MCSGIVYLMSRKRMPIAFRPAIFPRDVQQDMPANWCAGCRREIYEPGEALCRRCRGVKEYESETEPMLDLHPGKKPR